jgi:integrase
MDAALKQRLYDLLAGREDKRKKTLYFMMARFDRMAELGFNYDAFSLGPEAAQAEGDRFLLALRQRKEQELEEAKRTGRRLHPRRMGDGRANYVKNLKALCRLHRYSKDAVNWRIRRQAPAQRDVYTMKDLRALLTMPFKQSEERRIMRATMTAHLALGWRLGELRLLEDHDVDAATKTVFLRNPEKGNPQRRIPVEEPFFAASRAFGSWLKQRPIAPENPRAVWTYTDEKGVVRVCSEQKFGKFLSDAGKLVGVRANCTRGRHTRIAAWFAQGKHIGFVKDCAGHHRIDTLANYIEMVSAGLCKHLAKPTWFVSAQGMKEE